MMTMMMNMTKSRRQQQQQQHEIELITSAVGSSVSSCWHGRIQKVGVFVILLPVSTLLLVSLLSLSSRSVSNPAVVSSSSSSSTTTTTTRAISSSIFHYGLGQRSRRRLTESVPSSATKADANDTFLQRTSDAHLPLFHVSDMYTTIGPTSFPKPNEIAWKMIPKDVIVSDNNNPKSTTTTTTTRRTVKLVNNFKPTIGKHRTDQDAIFIFAAEYNLNTYILFLSTLQETKYVGDVVIAISNMDYQDASIRQYLESFSSSDTDDNGHNTMNIVVYVLDGLECYNAEMQIVDSMKGGIRVCQLNNLYGYTTVVSTTKTTGDADNGAANGNGNADSGVIIIPLKDPRPARTVPTTRYELYWIWIQHYNSHQWIMLIDARDTIFQSNPFINLPRRRQQVVVGGDDDESSSSSGRSSGSSGRLYFFGENIEATRIGKSKKNRKWLQNAYGNTVVTALEDKPTICSGSTMGEQVAIETYLRAMVNESDETGTKLMGADQGFHNYLYYSNKLANANSIKSITVFDQGFAIINNLGAMRTKELNEWGNGKLIEFDNQNVPRVLNWDGTLSPVVHQFDRHKVLSEYWYRTKTDQYRQQWMKKKDKRLQQQ